MHSDAYFAQGRRHRLCQDYAMAGRTPAAPKPTWPLPGDPDPETLRKTFAIVSDGCSESPDTDFGARFLVRRAAANIDVFGKPRVDLAVDNAWLSSRQLRLSDNCLDATLLAAYQHEDTVLVEIYGDGVVAARERRTGALTVHSVEFPSGAPLYPSYWLKEARFQHYLKKFGSVRQHTVDTVRLDGARETTKRDGAPYVEIEDGAYDLVPICVSFDRATYDVVAVMSDGMGSFKQRRGNGFESVPLEDAVTHAMSFKGFAGEFVVRRMRAFLQDAADEGWHHDDDVSMAAIYMGAP